MMLPVFRPSGGAMQAQRQATPGILVRRLLLASYSFIHTVAQLLQIAKVRAGLDPKFLAK
jgi:hypothetical protein